MLTDKLQRCFNLCNSYFLICVIIISGCSPTYPGVLVPKSIKDICKEEYSIDVDVKIVDKTLGLYLVMDELIESSGEKSGISKKANEEIGNLISVIHRVVLSTDRPLEFYVVVIRDKQLPSVAFTLLRNIEDVRKANSYTISTTEFFKRSLMDLSIIPEGAKEDIDFIQGAVLLPRFLTLQMAKRIEGLFTKPWGGAEEPKSVSITGEFLQKSFIFFIDTDLKEVDAVELFSKALTEILEVLKGYQFKDYTSIKLIHISTKKSIGVSREDAQSVIQKRLTLESLLSRLL